LEQTPNYTSIQAAINAAANGDTIIVGPGWYNERITISKPITLTGATAGESKKGYNVPGNYNYNDHIESIIAPQNMLSTPIITIERGNVTIDGFIISMTVSGSYTPYPPLNLYGWFLGGI
jgi:pectin methylesterase-like acyl-CoA thioesterase